MIVFEQVQLFVFDSYLFAYNSLSIEIISLSDAERCQIAKSAECFHEHPVLSQTSRTREETGLRGSLEVVDS